MKLTNSFLLTALTWAAAFNGLISPPTVLSAGDPAETQIPALSFSPALTHNGSLKEIQLGEGQP